MEQTEIDKLLALREAWDKYKSSNREEKEVVDDYYKVLWTYGIERRDEIEKFNNEMCLSLLKEQYTFGGKCDLCGEQKEITPCELYAGIQSCGATKNPAPIDEKSEILYYLILASLRTGIIPPKNGESIIVTGLKGTERRIYSYDNKFSPWCPPYHGYYFNYEIPIEDKKPFDISWVP